MATIYKSPEVSDSDKIFIPRNNYWQEYVIRYSMIALISVVTTVLKLNYQYGDGDLLYAFLISFIRVGLIWNGSMLIIQYSVNRFSMFRETLKLIVFQIITLTIYVFAVELFEIITVEHLFKITLSTTEKQGIIGVSLLITFMISAIYAAVSFFIQWKENLLRAQALEKANLEARYDTLQSQVNPHFLFNSLNALTMLVNDNPRATRYVESMAGIMRYMLQSRDKEVVPVGEEVLIAIEYLFIQQNRFGDKLIVELDIPEQYYHFSIPPLTLQMLLENSIKHNVISREHPLHVSVFVSETGYIVVQNSVKTKVDREPSTGVGLENIRNRYLYLTDKEIVVKEEDGRFIVMLPLFEKTI